MFLFATSSRYFFITACVAVTVNMYITQAAINSPASGEEDITFDNLKIILNNPNAIQEHETREKLSCYFQQNKNNDEALSELIMFLFAKFNTISSFKTCKNPIELDDFDIAIDNYGWFYMHIILMLSQYLTSIVSQYLKPIQENEDTLRALVNRLKRYYGYDKLFKIAVINLRIGVIESKKSKKKRISLDDFKKENFDDENKDIFYMRIVPMFSQYLKQYAQDPTTMEQQFLDLTSQLEKDYGVEMVSVIIVANLSFNGMTEQEILEWSNQMSQGHYSLQRFKSLMVFLSERYMPSYFQKYFFPESQHPLPL